MNDLEDAGQYLIWAKQELYKEQECSSTTLEVMHERLKTQLYYSAKVLMKRVHEHGLEQARWKEEMRFLISQLPEEERLP